MTIQRAVAQRSRSGSRENSARTHESPAGTQDRLLVDVKTLAHLLSLSRAQVYVLLHRGELPGSVHIGRRRLFNVEVIREWTNTKARETSEGVENDDETWPRRRLDLSA